MVFHRSLSGSKSPQVSRILLGILADLNNAVVWMVSTRPVFSKSSSPSIDPLVNVPSARITIGITVTFICHSLFFFGGGEFYSNILVLFLFSLCFSFTQ